jgi:pimeloyl-ACP methyl ester carboxylesterase
MYEWDNSRIHYWSGGTGQPAVVFLHSALMDHRQWDDQVAWVERHRQAVTYDLIGYGKSSDVAGPVDPAEHFVRLADHLGLDRLVLVGSSLGGSIALHVATTCPERVAGLFLAGPGLLGFEPDLVADDPPVYREYEAAFVDGDLDRILTYAETIWLHGIGANPEDTPLAARQRFRMLYHDFLLHHPWEGPDLGDINDVPHLATIAVPTLVAIGVRDTAYCQAVAGYLAGVIPEVRVVHLAGAAHFPNLSAPQAFNHLLDEWLSTVVPSAQ